MAIMAPLSRLELIL